MSPASFRLGARDGRGAREATALGDEARAGDADRTSDPLAFDPLSPLPPRRHPAGSADPLSFDPLSPLGPDAG